jgi:hypothetical protein
MEITNSTFYAASFYQSDRSTQNKSVNNNTVKTANVEIDSTEIEYTKGYDLENITPHETYALANELYNKEEISVFQLASMMIIGLKHEYSLTNKPFDASLKNNEPFNLMDELENIAHKEIDSRLETQNLIDILLSLPEESLKIKQSSIDISV